jgi:hypothetical protein
MVIKDFSCFLLKFVLCFTFSSTIHCELMYKKWHKIYFYPCYPIFHCILSGIPHWIFFVLLLKVNWTCLHGLVSEFSVLCHWSKFLLPLVPHHFGPCHSIVSLEVSVSIPTVFFLKLVLAILGPVYFHSNFRISLYIFKFKKKL